MNTQNRAQIVVGSTFAFTLYLLDGDGRPVSLAPYSAAKLIFSNAAGTRTEIELESPGESPDKGEFSVSGTATDADSNWTSADLELTGEGDAKTIIPISNKFDIVKRNTPAA